METGKRDAGRASEVLVKFYFFIWMVNAWVSLLCDSSLRYTFVPCERFFIYMYRRALIKRVDVVDERVRHRLCYSCHRTVGSNASSLAPDLIMS